MRGAEHRACRPEVGVPSRCRHPPRRIIAAYESPCPFRRHRCLAGPRRGRGPDRAHRAEPSVRTGGARVLPRTPPRALDARGDALPDRERRGGRTLLGRRGGRDRRVAAALRRRRPRRGAYRNARTSGGRGRPGGAAGIPDHVERRRAAAPEPRLRLLRVGDGGERTPQADPRAGGRGTAPLLAGRTARRLHPGERPLRHRPRGWRTPAHHRGRAGPPEREARLGLSGGDLRARELLRPLVEPRRQPHRLPPERRARRPAFHRRGPHPLPPRPRGLSVSQGG